MAYKYNTTDETNRFNTTPLHSNMFFVLLEKSSTGDSAMPNVPKQTLINLHTELALLWK